MMENWYVPISLVPGIGLLILSTANLMVSLSNELHGLIKDEMEKEEEMISRKMKQLKSLNQAMVCFYVSVAFLATAGMIGGLHLEAMDGKVIYVSIVGISIMILGLFTLIKYSLKAVSIRQDQLKIKIRKR